MKKPTFTVEIQCEECGRFFQVGKTPIRTCTECLLTVPKQEISEDLKLVQQFDLDDLTEWERDFIVSIEQRLTVEAGTMNPRPLSPKQKAILDKLVEKYL